MENEATKAKCHTSRTEPAPLLLTCGLVALMVFGFVLCGCGAKTNRATLWPSGAVRMVPTDYKIDSEKQLNALRKANPSKDAVSALSAFCLGDFRFISDDGIFPRILGVPDDAIVNESRRKFGFKFIATSRELVSIEDFEKLKCGYLEVYNRALFTKLSKPPNTRWQQS